MNQRGLYWKITGYLFAANFQAVTLIWGGFWLGKTLEASWSKDWPWQSLSTCLGLVLAFYNYYLCIAYIIKLERKSNKEQDENEV